MTAITGELRNVIGERGEGIVRELLTNYERFEAPLFRPVLLGEKHRLLDFYVELTGKAAHGGFFFAQVKTTIGLPRATSLNVPSVSHRHGTSLLAVPAPTFVFGVQEKYRRVYAVAVRKPRTEGFRAIPLKNELSPAKLRLLFEEVAGFWADHGRKPAASAFDL